jgi:hypothetical protein
MFAPQAQLSVTLALALFLTPRLPSSWFLAETKLSPDLGLAFFTLRAEDKPPALLFLLREVVPQGQATIVFAATRHHVDFLAALLR